MMTAINENSIWQKAPEISWQEAADIALLALVRAEERRSRFAEEEAKIGWEEEKI